LGKSLAEERFSAIEPGLLSAAPLGSTRGPNTLLNGEAVDSLAIKLAWADGCPCGPLPKGFARFEVLVGPSEADSEAAGKTALAIKLPISETACKPRASDPSGVRLPATGTGTARGVNTADATGEYVAALTDAEGSTEELEWDLSVCGCADP
jgi:hypothetical protein